MEDVIADLIGFRRYLHQHPELSTKEKNTSAYILQQVKKCNPDLIIEFENYGLAVIYKGKEKGKNLLIRGDFDALPIQEVNDFDYKSQNEGVSHKCGHDGHTTILYGLAQQFAKEKPAKGDVILLFQPAEENGAGARRIVAFEDFKKLTIDYAVALHNLPGFAKHSIICKEGTFTAAVNSIIIKLNGKTSHAGEPELGINPAMAIAEIIKAYADMNRPDPENKEFQLITPIYSKMGELSYGVSAGYGEIHFTLRAWDNERMKKLEKECAELAQKIGKKNELSVEIDWTESFFANENDTNIVKAIYRAANTLKLDYNQKKTPFKWGEDFGIFTSKLKGAMFGLGAGEKTPALHNPDYDFPDELIETGIKMMKEIQKGLAEA